MQHYGFLIPRARPDIESVRWLVTLHNGEVWTLLATELIVQAATPQGRCAPRTLGRPFQPGSASRHASATRRPTAATPRPCSPRTRLSPTPP